jgi:hypothetical protein
MATQVRRPATTRDTPSSLRTDFGANGSGGTRPMTQAAPTPVTTLEAAADRVRTARGRVEDLTKLMQHVGDRAFGSQPEGASSGKDDGVGAAGTVGMLSLDIEQLHNAVTELEYQIRRFEGI